MSELFSIPGMEEGVFLSAEEEQNEVEFPQGDTIYLVLLRNLLRKMRLGF